jgi:hypothetical protein
LASYKFSFFIDFFAIYYNDSIYDILKQKEHVAHLSPI